MKLYELSKDIARLEYLIESETSNSGNQLEEAQTYLNELKIEKADKIESCVALLKNWAALEEAIKAEETALKARRDSLQKRAEWLKHYIGFHLQPGDKFETARCKITWRKSESLEVTDESQVPDEYTEQVVTRKINKALIKDAIKSGADVPGAQLLKKNNLIIK
jgi:hypothetical protein